MAFLVAILSFHPVISDQTKKQLQDFVSQNPEVKQPEIMDNLQQRRRDYYQGKNL